MFRKARRVNVRKRNDSEEEEREHEVTELMVPPAAPPPSFPHIECGVQAAKAREPKAKEPKAKLLSFQDDDDEEEVFKVKKSNHSKKIVKILKNKYKEDQEKTNPGYDVLPGSDGDQPVRNLIMKDGSQEDINTGSDLGEEEMEVESEKEEEKPKAGSFANSLSSLNVLRPGEIPDAAFIHAARKKRQMARELGDIPSLDADGGKRLVREDENDASDDDDDDEKRRIVFSVREKSQRQKIAEEIGIEGSDDEALATGEQDEEISRWEQEQIRKGISIPQVQAHPPETNNLFYPSTYQGIPYGSSYNVPYNYSAFGSAETKPPKPDNSVSFKTSSNEMTPVTIDLVKNQLKDR